MHVPPSNRRTPPGLAMPALDAATGSWFKRVIVRASSYVVPPIMKIITSCGLSKISFGRIFMNATEMITFVVRHLLQRLQGRGNLFPSAFL
jgi:hypothetical protein